MMRRFSKKAIVIEPNRFHRETLPSITYLLNQMGYFVEIYTARKAHINNPFNGLKNLHYRKHSIEGPFFWMDKVRKFKDYDLIVWNSIEPEKWVDDAKLSTIPTICTMHSASLLHTNSLYKSFFSESHRCPVVLAQHIGSPKDDYPTEIPWLFPILPPETTKHYPMSKKLTQPIQFCTQGYLNFQRRDYASLIEAAYTLHQSETSKFEINIICNSNTVDGTLMQNQLEQLKIKHLFKFHHQTLPFGEMYEEFSQMHFILPLINWESDMHAKSYFLERGSFTFPLALQFKIIPIAHRRLAACYRWGEAIIPHQFQELAQGMSEALNMSPEDYDHRQEKLDTIRASYLDHNLSEIEAIIKKISK
jgi:hypothetical protein